jgi:hypothetical protein
MIKGEKMKFNLLMISLLALISSCSSVDTLKKKTDCAVWRDQKYMGPYSIDVVGKKSVWTGKCQGNHWKCKNIEVYYDDKNLIFLNGPVNIGKIINNEFQFAAADAAPLITYTALRAYPETREVKASILENSVNTETVYHYNDKCSSEDAIVGSIALGLVWKAQEQK